MFGRYNYINNTAKLKELDAYLMDGKTPRYKYIAYDTETNGLDYYKTTIVGISLATDREKGFYIPLLEWVPDKNSQKARTIDKVKYLSFMEGKLRCVWTGKYYEEFVKPRDYKAPHFLKLFLKRWLTHKSVRLLMHNAPFDINHTYINFGIDLANNLFMDTALLAHIVNENSLNGLKEVSEEWKDSLGIDPKKSAKMEQLELGESVLINGGEFRPKKKTIWRADPKFMGKYAASDAFLTHGVFEVGMNKFIKDFGKEKLDWLMKDEVMPLCREVVTPMKRRGVFIDVPYFEKLDQETAPMLETIEDRIIKNIIIHLKDFKLGKSMDEVVSNQAFVKKIIELENLEIPKKYDKKTDKWKPSLAKAVVAKEYQENPHWIWGYLLGEDELKYSEKRQRNIKQDLYRERTNGKRYRFNIGSDAHLRWLFFDKLGYIKKDFPQTDSATKDNPIPSMKAEVLQQYFLEKHKWVKDLLLFKKIRKLYNSYILPANTLNINGWLYLNMRQNGTVSGRFACSGGFNLQTLPRAEEIDVCPKCGSKAVKFEKIIELLTNVECSDCGHRQENIIVSSAIKKGFIAPPGYKIIAADFSSLEPRCLIKGTKISTTRGLVNIEDVKKGDKVLTRSGFKRVNNILNKRSNTLKILTNKGSIESTPDHKIFIKNKGWIEAKDLKLNEEVIINNYTALTSEARVLSLPLYAEGVNSYNKRDLKYKKIGDFYFNEEWSWLLGAYLGDGLASLRSRKGFKNKGKNRTGWAGYVGICGLLQDNVIDKFTSIFEEYGFHLSSWRDKRTDGMVQAIVCGNSICNLFKNTLNVLELDVGKVLRIPNYLMNSGIELKTAFLAGLIDTDGSVKNKYPTIEVTIHTKSHEFATDIVNLLKTINIESSITYASHKKTTNYLGCEIKICQKGVYELAQYNIFDKMACKRKADTLKLRLKNFPKTYCSNPKNPSISKIINLKEEKEVFDLGVDDVHEYFANGILVHNCFAYNSGDSKLKEVYQKDLDLYSKVYCDMLDVEGKYSANPKDDNYLKKVNNPARSLIKPVVLGIPYGAKAPQTANLMGLRYTRRVKDKETGKWKEIQALDVEQGKYYRDLYLNTYPKLKDYMLTCEMDCIIKGSVQTLVGRKRHFQYAPLVYEMLSALNIDVDKFLDMRYNDLEKQNTSIGLNREGLELFSQVTKIPMKHIHEKGDWAYVRGLFKQEYNNSKNAPIQGLAAHITNRAMLEADRLFKKLNIDGYLCLQVHDEIIAYVREDQVDKAAKVIQVAMEKNKYAKMIDVPMIAEPLIANNLKEAK